VLLPAHVDSGCSGSLTPHRATLINTRPCADRFAAADGIIYPATLIGDMPVVATDSTGKRCRLTLRNVRHVPGFKYTLLSVRQMWQEQRIDAQFASVNALVLSSPDRTLTIPFASSSSLPVVNLVSAATIPPGGDTAHSAPALSATALSGDMVSASSRPLGFRRIGTASHVARLPAAQAAELLYRRCLLGVDKIRAAPNTTSDAPRILASASAVPPNAAVAAARIRRMPHSTTLTAPAPEPGVLHIDLKELVVSIGGYRYVVFAIDEHSRFVFVDFIKVKSDVANSAKRLIAAFEATVGTPVDEAGRALPRPRVRAIHSDREGKLMSKLFLDFRADMSVHHTTSPPNDHDLNPIAERIIGLISETASATRAASGAPAGYWPWIISYVVDWHNSTVGSVGSSTADAAISPHQRFTLRPPRVMDLAAFGCRAVVLKPPTHQHKPSLSTRGWVGTFLGRSRHSKGAYDVLVGNSVVTSSSLVVDEEHFEWAPNGRKHHPLTAASHAASQPQHSPLSSELTPASSVASAPATYDRQLRFLDLFSGPYARTDGLAAALRSDGWRHVDMIDNDGETGGGWAHCMSNDSKYSELMAKARAGHYDSMHIAFPCSTGALSRLFDASTSGDGDSGPPMVRDASRPDGLPEDELDPKHIRELKNADLLLTRTVNLAIAARLSSSRTRISLEQPADRSDKDSIAYAPDLSHHGSILATTEVKRLISTLGMKSRTFAYCRLGAPHQKYTTILYTPDLGAVLDDLDAPRYQCNHPRGTHAKRVRGRDPDGSFSSKWAAAYPTELCKMISRAHTRGCTGSDQVPSPAVDSIPPADSHSVATPRDSWSDSHVQPPTAPSMLTSPAGGVPAAAARVPPSAVSAPPSPEPAPPHSPISFPSLSDPPAQSDVPPRSPLITALPSGPDALREGPEILERRLSQATAANPSGRERVVTRARASQQHVELQGRLPAIVEEPASSDRPSSPLHSPGGTATSGYLPFSSGSPSLAAEVMEDAVVKTVLLAASEGHSSVADDLIPITPWARSARAPARNTAMPVLIALLPGEKLTQQYLSSLQLALRADSPGAPASHAEAVRAGAIWVKAEEKELRNHSANSSWTTISRSEVPAGRRIHKLIWVYKLKRDGTAKARLCVQGNTLQSGVDYDQVFSAALRYSSARALFAYASRNDCRVRSVDLVAAYLQGKFVDGEVVYTHLPTGYPEYDSDGTPRIARVVKPIYGIQQAGRRLQRMLFAWLLDQGFAQLDDSDGCVFTRSHADGEILTIGVYVDNLQIVHSARLNGKGRGPDGCAYNAFMDRLAAEWDVVDEGPMEDLLGIEIEYLPSGSIKLHQTTYIRKLIERFCPDGYRTDASTKLPYSSTFLQSVADALAAPAGLHPELVKELQERIGCLLYAATSTRPDIAFPVQYLCRCLHRPTPALIAETDHVFAYLARHSSAGLTYDRPATRLSGHTDASWETAASTSGWVVQWQGAALHWGSRKQPCVALSTCEAEIIALSEGAKDMVYFRKLVSGLNAPEPGPSSLATDSQSARDVSYNPQHHDRMKHVQRRHFFVRDMVESFELEVPFVRTADNVADMFTKPMKNPNEFHKLRRLIMNES
jgi:hypothetical protein